MKKKINDNLKIVLILSLFFFVSLIPFYWLRGHPVGWGDTGLNSFFYNSDYLIKIYKYTWFSESLTGYSVTQGVTLLPLLYLLFSSYTKTNYYLQQSLVYSLIIFFSMIFTFFLTLQLFKDNKNKIRIAIFCSFFYAFNTLVMINYWHKGFLSIFLLPFIPLIFLFILLILEKFRFFYSVIFAILFSLFSINFLNPAFVIPPIIIMFLFVLYYLIINKSREDYRTLIKRVLFLLILTLLINSWFLLPFLSTYRDYYGNSVKQMDSLDTLKISSFSTSLKDLFMLIPTKINSDIWAYKNPLWRFFYQSGFFIFIGFLITLICVIPLFYLKKEKNTFFFYIIFILGIFLSLGLNSPFNYIFEYMFKNIPYFDIFRSPYNKFIPFLLISFTFLFGLGLNELIELIKPRIKFKSSTIFSIFALFLVCGVYVFPMWDGNIVNNPIVIRGNNISSFVEVPNYYNEISNSLLYNKLDYRIISLPLRQTNYVIFDWDYGYDGPDLTWMLYKHSTISNPISEYYPSSKILLNKKVNPITTINLFSVKSIILQEDVDTIHSNYNDNITYINKDFYLFINDSYLNSKKFGRLILYKLNSSFFLPHFYTPQNIIISNESIDTLPEIVSQPNYNIRSAIIFTNQTENLNKTSNEVLPSSIKNNPQLEFKKINPTKYRIVVHNASEEFPLVFSESYHNGWKTYLVDYMKSNLDSALLDNYKILDGNQEDQATKEEIIDFIANDYVSTLGDGKEKQIKHKKWENNKEKLDYIENYSIGFISKNFQGTIQNDNLINGLVYETWLKKPIINEDKHLIANGYANSWIINPIKICSENPDKCIKNQNGTYDLEIVVEFWPQRLFYIGLIISITTLILCIIYLVYVWLKDRKTQKYPNPRINN